MLWAFVFSAWHPRILYDRMSGQSIHVPQFEGGTSWGAQTELKGLLTGWMDLHKCQIQPPGYSLTDPAINSGYLRNWLL